MKTTRRNSGVRKAESLENVSRVHDGRRVDDEGEGGSATFDGKRPK